MGAIIDSIFDPGKASRQAKAREEAQRREQAAILDRQTAEANARDATATAQNQQTAAQNRQLEAARQAQAELDGRNAQEQQAVALARQTGARQEQEALTQVQAGQLLRQPRGQRLLVGGLRSGGAAANRETLG